MKTINSTIAAELGSRDGLPVPSVKVKSGPRSTVLHLSIEESRALRAQLENAERAATALRDAFSLE